MADERRVSQLITNVEVRRGERRVVTQVVLMVEVSPINPTTPYRNKTDGPFLQVV